MMWKSQYEIEVTKMSQTTHFFTVYQECGCHALVEKQKEIMKIKPCKNIHCKSTISHLVTPVAVRIVMGYIHYMCHCDAKLTAATSHGVTNAFLL